MDAANAPLSPLEPQPFAERSADPATLSGKRLLDRYRIDELIGQGGMAHVYSGRHLALDSEVAIKVLRQRFAQRQTVVDRFLQEARAASRVRHPHIVEVTDFGSTPDGLVFMVMERLTGETLADTIEREGGLPWPRVRAIALQLCDAMQSIHDAGIVHRDISLKNFFRLSRGKNPDFVKVLDFGIARITAKDDARVITSVRRLTSDAQIMGTPEFMSPEQATRSDTVDSRSDIYAMGVALYAMLTGRLPFAATTAVDMMAKHIYEPVPPPSQHVPELPHAVEAAILRALEKDPTRRFQSMAQLGHALFQIPEDARRSADESAATLQVGSIAAKPKRTRWAPVRRFTMIGVVAGLAWWGWQDSDRFLEGAAVLERTSATMLDSMAVPAPAAAATAKETVERAEPVLAAPAPVASATVPPPRQEIHPMSLPPAPPKGALEPERPKRVRGIKRKTAAPVIVPQPPRPMPTESPIESPIESPEPAPEAAVVVEPAPAVEVSVVPEPVQFDAIEEVKDPFAQ